jgi:ERCC4-type nuclease
MIIVVDTREKDEYTFGDIATIRWKLDAGDYSVAGLEDRIAIERKNPDDFVQTVIRQKKRFHQELCALAGMEFSAIVVEASWQDILDHKYKGAVNPLSVIESAVAIMLAYRVPVVMAGNRQMACHLTKSLLTKFEKRRG